MRINRLVMQQGPLLVQTNRLAAGPETGVDRQHAPAAERGRQQQLPQIVGENPDRLVVGPLFGRRKALVFDRRHDQPPERVAHGRFDQSPRRGIAPDEHPYEPRYRRLGVGERKRQFQKSLAFSAKQGQQPVRGHPPERKAAAEIVGILSALVLPAGDSPRRENRRAGILRADRFPGPGVFRDPLGHDIAGSGERLFPVGDLAPDETVGQPLGLAAVLTHQQRSQRLQPFFAGRRGPGTPLGLVRQIEVFQFVAVPAIVELRAQRAGHLSRRLDRRTDGPLARFERVQTFEPVADRSHLHFVEPAGRLLTVAGDERDRRPSLQQGHGPLDPGLRQRTQPGNLPDHSFVGIGHRSVINSEKTKE